MEPVNLTGQVQLTDENPRFTGNYSYVYRGVRNNQQVAIKVIRQVSSATPETMQRKVRRETVLWAALSHPNILPFYGFAENEEFGPFGALISPWCSNGDAGRFFAQHGDRLTTRKRIDLWKDTIAGINYLHSNVPIIVHGDLKPGNILVDDSQRAVICDFGLARIFLEEASSGMTTTTEHVGTARYLARELVSSPETEHPTTASDVYAVGCIGLEFVFGRKPYAHRKNNLRGRIIVDILRGIPPSEEPDNIAPGMWPYWELIRTCWNADPSERPTVQRLLADINETPGFQTDTSHVSTTIDLSVDDREEDDFEMGDGPTPKEPENLTGQVTVDMSDPKFRGNYSLVHRGMYKGQTVAVKIIQEIGKPESMGKKVTREMTIWANTNHRNIHPFYGFAEDEVFKPYGALISPWCENGDAAQFLKKNGSISFADRLQLWKGVIDGVAYLHGGKRKIVHGDLKPGNILIDNERIPRICDFGLARIFIEEEGITMTTTEHTGTERYLAPELVVDEEDTYPTTASDVYALGCLGLEIVLGQVPFCHRKNNLRGRIMTDLKNKVPPAVECPASSPPVDIWPLLQRLWASNPVARPSASKAAAILEAMPPI